MKTIQEAITKQCVNCNEEKEIKLFTPDKRSPLGVRNTCKKCTKILRGKYQKEYYQLNKEKKKEAARLWKLNNEDKVVEYKKEYAKLEYVKQKNRDRSNKSYHDNDGKRKQYLKTWYYQNVDTVRKSKRDWFRKNIGIEMSKKREEIHGLSDSYLKDRIRIQYGINAESLKYNPEIIELKRFELKVKRYIKQINN